MTSKEMVKTPDVEQALIVDKTLIIFTPPVRRQNRADILESMLFAQMGANNKVPDETNSINWYNAHIDTLSEIGWEVEGGELRNLSTSANDIELHNVIINILTGAFGSCFVRITSTALDRIRSIAGTNGKIEAVEKNTHTENSGSFQVAVATEESGLVAIRLGTFLITTTDTIKHILFIKLGKVDTSLQYTSSRLTLDKNVYDNTRQLIQQKLKGKTTQFVTEIPLS
jgi:hypothetical protein